MKVQNTIGKKVALSTCGMYAPLGTEGFEPSMAVPKTAALPLGYAPKIIEERGNRTPVTRFGV